MEEQTITAPAAEGTGTESPALETTQVAQATPEPQEASTVQVENGSNEPQVPETPRRKPSDYYRERQTIRELKETVSMLQKRMEEKATLKEDKKSDVPAVPDFDPAHFSPEHKRILLAREQALRAAYDEKVAAIEQRLNGWQENKAQEETSRKHQEALEKLFPKTSPDSKETLEERIKKDPERAIRVKQLLIDSGLNELSKTNPDAAIKYALWELGEGPKPTNPTILKKALMGGVGTGNPGMGGKNATNEQDLRAENKKLSDQLDANPSLRQDVKFMERRAQVLTDLERLVKEKR